MTNKKQELEQRQLFSSFIPCPLNKKLYLCTRKTESSAVGSALRSGRRGRAFESPLSDKSDDGLTAIAFLFETYCPQ